MPELILIPQPRSIEAGPEGAEPFPLAAGAGIVVAHGAERREWLAAQSVQAALRAHGVEAPIQPQIRCPDTARSILLAVRGRDEAAFPDALDAGNDAQSAEGYSLRVDGQRVAVWGNSPDGLVQGTRTLCQLLAQAGGALDALRIVDAPALPWRGVMLDISRGKVPTLETLKGLVDILASYKLNMLQVYTEHTFAFRRHPDIGRAWGGLTPEEIVTLDHYCRDRAIELVPCLQSFGHLRRILELPAYEHLAESDERWSLSPAVEESYALLDDLYADHLACFSSRYVNVCSDETYDLAQGKSKALADQVGAGRVYLSHIIRLHGLAAKYGRQTMVWDDIFLHYPDLVREIPTDMILLNWEYEAQDDYPQVNGFHEAGLAQIVCPGVSTWNTLFPRLANARGNIRNFVAAGLRVGAGGMLNTDWGDGGHPNLLGGSWYGYAYGAAEAWSPGALDDAEFERRFAALHFGPAEAGLALEAMRALSEACTLPTVIRRNGSYTIEMLFADPLKEKHCKEISDETLARVRDLAAHAHALLAGLQGRNAEAARTLAEFRLAAGLIVHAARKTQAGRRIAAVADETARHALELELRAIKEELHALRRAYQAIWLVRNKPEGLSLTLDLLDQGARALDRWREEVKPGYRHGQ